MGKRYVMQMPYTPKKFKYDEYVNTVTLDNNNLRLSKDLVVNTVVTDINKKKWRLGKPIGKGSFGELYTASKDINNCVPESADYVIKIEPHTSGTLFTEINCLVRIGRLTEDSSPVPGVPIYIASGSHIFSNKRYRFMIIPRYRVDLSYLLQRNKVSIKNILTIAIQILDILEYIHSKGFAHSDIKAQNLMIGVNKKKYNEGYYDDQVNSFITNDVPFSKVYNPVRKCRAANNNKLSEFIESRSLRTKRRINYEEASESDDIESINSSYSDEFDEDTDDESSNSIEIKKQSCIESERIFLIDYGLASKFINSRGCHRAFYVDERRAHDGTLEYTSRDAHFGAHSRRSDLECLGYNLLDWITGDLPWKEENILLQPEIVHRMKVCFMSNVRQMMNYCYKGKYPDFIRKYLEYVYAIDYTQDPDYDYCRSIFMAEYKRLGFPIHEMMKINFDNIQNGLDDFKCLSEKPSLQNLAFSLLISNENSFKKFSPKNLRSKQLNPSYSPKKLRSKSCKKSFTWNDILCNEAENLLQLTLDEMACRDEVNSNISNDEECIKYEGKPTYAIKIVLKCLREAKAIKKGKSEEKKSDEILEPDGLTYAMKLVIEKKNIRDNKENINKSRKTTINTKASRRSTKSSKETITYSHNIVDEKKKSGMKMNDKYFKVSRLEGTLNIEDICDFRLRSNRKSSLRYNRKEKRHKRAN